MNKIEFKDIVKLVHPDKNPDIKDASTKMALIIANKNDPYKLYNLAKEWNLLTDDIINRISFDEILLWIDVNSPDSVDQLLEITKYQDDEHKLYELAEKWELFKKIEIYYTIEEGKDIIIENEKGVIVDVIDNNENGIKVIVFINDGYKSYYRGGIRDQDKNFYVSGYTPESEYINRDLLYQNFKSLKGVK